MDIKKELKEIENNLGYYDKAVDDILSEQRILQKKLHLIKIITLAKQMEKAVNDGIFDAPKLDTISFSFRYCDDDRNYALDFSFRNNKGYYISEHDYKTPYKKQIKFCQNLLSKIGVFEVQLTNRNNPSKEMDLKSGIKDRVLDLLLCEELKKIYEYNKMEVELPMNNVEQSNKLKI